MNRKYVLLLTFLGYLFPALVFGQENAMAGRWKTIDDKTGKEKSIVLIWIDESGNLNGKIEKLFRNPDEDQNPVCDKCSGTNKNAPMSGMQILWGFTPNHKKNNNVWNSGNILDPKTGVIYNCNLAINDSGDRLEVRGYMGISLIGRTQTWVRIVDK